MTFATLCDRISLRVKVYVPLLILQGDKDTLVPIKSSMELYENLPVKEKNLVILNGYTHDIFREKDNKALIEVEKFLL